MHPRAIGVKNADDADIDAVLAVVVEKQRLGAAFALVVAGTFADGIHVAPVALGLRMHGRIAVDLARAGLKDPGPHTLGETEAIDRAHDGGLGRLDRVELVVRRRGGAGEIVDLVHLELKRIDHIMPHELKTRVLQEVGDVLFPTGEQVIDDGDVMIVRDEAVTEMGAEETGAAGDEDTHGEKGESTSKRQT